MVRLGLLLNPARHLAAAVLFCAVAVILPAEGAAKCRPGAKPIALQTDKVRWLVSPCRGGIESIKLLQPQFQMKEPTATGKEPSWARDKFAAGPLELVSTWDAKWDPFRAVLTGAQATNLACKVREKPGDPAKPQVFPSIDALFAHSARFGVVSKSESQVSLVWPDPALIDSPIYLVRSYATVADKPFSLDIRTEIHNLGAQPFSFALRHKLTTYRDPNEQSGGFLSALTGPADLKGAGFHIAGETVHLDTTELADADPEERARAGTPEWIAADSRYFLLAEMPTDGWRKGTGASMADLGNGVIEAVLQSQGEALAPAANGCAPAWHAAHWQTRACEDDFKQLGLEQAPTEAVAEPFLEAAKMRGKADPEATAAAIARVRGRRIASFGSRIYTGPKRIELLRETADHLDEAIDFGWFSAIAKPLLWVLKFAHSLTGNWPIAILILTVLVKGALWPITGKSLKSMRKMQTLKPELDRIKAKLEEEARREGLDRPDPNKLNQETFALYKRHGVNPLGGCLPMFIQMPVYIALYRTIYSSVELFNQPLFAWVTDLTQRDPYFVLPVLLGAAMFVQTRLTPQTGGDETQRKIMMWVMPIMFTFMMAWLPSGLTLYILANTVMSSAQTLWLHRNEQAAASA